MPKNKRPRPLLKAKGPKTSAVQVLGRSQHEALPMPMGFEASQSVTKPSPRGGTPSRSGRVGRAHPEDFEPTARPSPTSRLPVEGPAPTAVQLAEDLSGQQVATLLADFRAKAVALRGELATRWQNDGALPTLGMAGARLSQAIRALDRLSAQVGNGWGEAQRTELQMAVNSVVFADASLHGKGGKQTPRSLASSLASAARKYKAVLGES